MDKKTGTIITIVVAVLTLCCSLVCCGGGIISLTGGGSYYMGTQSSQLPAWTGIPGICAAILVWAVPILLWVFLVRNAKDEEVDAPMDV